MDTFVGGFPLLFVGLFEIIAIIYVYGKYSTHCLVIIIYYYMLSVFKEPILLSHVFILSPLHLIGFFRFKRDIELMLGSNIVISAFFLYFGATWLLISPVALLVCSKSFKCERFLNKKSYASINWYVINFHQSTNIA